MLLGTHSSISDEKKWEDDFKEKHSCWVLIGYFGTKRLQVINKKFDNSGRILLLEIIIDGSLFVLINIYNTNSEPDQLKNLADLGEILYCVGDIRNKNKTFVGNFNVIFDYFLEVQGEKASLKKAHFSKINSNKGNSLPYQYFGNPKYQN